MKNFVVSLLVLAMVFAPIMVSAETKGFYREDIQLTPTSKVVQVIQIYGTAWYGGATQGFQALIQMVTSEKLTQQKIKLAWYKQTGKCPNDDQITAVWKGWNETMIWLKEKGPQEELVQIFSSFGYPLDAPGPKVLAAIVKMVSDVGVAAIGGYFLKAAFAALRPDNNTYTANQTGGGATATGGTGYGGQGGQGGRGGKGGNAIAVQSQDQAQSQAQAQAQAQKQAQDQAQAQGQAQAQAQDQQL